MAYAKKTAKNEAYQKLKTDLKEGNPLGNAYLFYGEESYLREYYLGEIRKRLIPAGFEEFNYHALEGKDLTAQSLTEMAEAMPMMAERTLIVVTDWDIYKLSEDQRERFIALLEDLPEYCCIVFVYDTMAYKQNKTVKKLCKAMDAHVTPIEFKAQDTSDLTAWIARRFRALGKQIDRQTAEYLIFLCGGLMTGLSQEIAKIGAYAKGEVITQRDIDAVADPVLSAEIFKMTDAVSQSDYNKAAAILGDLLKMQEELEVKQYEAAAGGGVVKAVVNGKHEVVSLTIDPEAVDPEDVEMLQDMVVAAVNEAMRKAEADSAQNMSKLTGGLNLGGLFG